MGSRVLFLRVSSGVAYTYSLGAPACESPLTSQPLPRTAFYPGASGPAISFLERKNKRDLSQHFLEFIHKIKVQKITDLN